MSIQVFVSHAPDDRQRCAPLLAALQSWGVEYWFDTSAERAGGQLSTTAQTSLAACDVLLRICTQATHRSYWMSLEAGAFLSLLADDHGRQMAGRRRLVNLVLQEGYQREPFDVSATLVDATNPKQVGWVNELRSALGLAPLDDDAEVAQMAVKIGPAPVRHLSRRAALGLAAGGAVGLGLAATGGVLALRAARDYAPPMPVPTATVIPPSRDPALRWWLATGNPATLGAASGAISASLVLDGATLYVGSEQGQLYALDRSTGRPRWIYSPGVPATGIFQSPVVANDIAYIVEKNIGVIAVRNGAALWTDTGDAFAHTTLTLSRGTLYVSAVTTFAFVDEIDLTTGAHGAGISTYTNAAPASAPTFAGDLMYIGASDGYLYAFDTTRPANRALWRADVGAAAANRLNQPDSIYVQATPRVADGTVYAASLDNNLYALDAHTGAKYWTFATGGAITASSPVVADGLAYVGSEDNTIYAVDAATGERRWRYATGAGVSAAVAFAAGIVYASSKDANIHALDSQSGKLIRKYATATGIVVPPLIADGVLHTADLFGYVYAFTL